MAPIQEAIKVDGFLKLRRLIRNTPGATLNRGVVGNRNALQFAVLETAFVIAVVATINWYFELVFNGKTTVYAGGTAASFLAQVSEEFRTIFLPTAISLGAIVSARFVVWLGLSSHVKHQLGTRSLVDAFHFSEGAYGLLPNVAVAASISIVANAYYFGNRMDEAGLFTLNELDNLTSNPFLLMLLLIVGFGVLVSFATIIYANFLASPRKLINDIEFQLGAPVTDAWKFYSVNAISRLTGTAFVSAIALILSILATFVFYVFTDNLRSGLGLTSFEGRAHCELAPSFCERKNDNPEAIVLTEADQRILKDMWLNEINRKFGRVDPPHPSAVRFQEILTQLNSGASENRRIEAFIVLDAPQIAGDVWVYGKTAVSSAVFLDRTEEALIAFLTAHASIQDASGDLSESLKASGFFDSCSESVTASCLSLNEREISSMIGPETPQSITPSNHARYREIEINRLATNWVTHSGFAASDLLDAIEDSMSGEPEAWVNQHRMSPNMWRRIKISEMRNGERFGRRSAAPRPERVIEYAATIRAGTIVARRQVEIKPDRSVIGARGGAVIGLSNAPSEHERAPSGTPQLGYAYTIEFSDGNVKQFVQPIEVAIPVGAKVNVKFAENGVEITPAK